MMRGYAKAGSFDSELLNAIGQRVEQIPEAVGGNGGHSRGGHSRRIP